MAAPPTALLTDGLVRQLIELGYADENTGALTGATVDNASVNTAIEEDAAATLASLGADTTGIALLESADAATALAALGADATGIALLESADAATALAALGADTTGIAVLESADEATAIAALGLTEVATQTTVQLEVVAPGTAVATGDSQAVFVIPAVLNGANLVGIVTYSTTAGETGTQDVQIHRVRAGTPADVLTTKCTQDSTEKSSTTAETAAVIDATKDDVATDDEYHVDVDAVQTTPAEGLFVTFVFEVPLA